MLPFRPFFRHELGLHLLMWVAYFIFDYLAYANYSNGSLAFVVLFACSTPPVALFTYITLYSLIPRFFQPRRYLTFLVSLLLVLSATTLLHRLTTYYVYLAQFKPEQFIGVGLWSTSALWRSAFYVLTISGLFITFNLLRYRYRQQQTTQELLNAQMTAELKTLREQINPHFLLNTLNNLYGLTRSNPDKASKIVLRLSHLMQYMLYEGNRDQVLLTKEIAYLQDYIELEKIRYDDQLQVAFQIRGEINKISIAPLLLLPFIENAFKHGLSRQLDAAYLQIDLWASPTELIVKVVNSKPLAEEPFSAQTGIGLDNVVKRLQLLYPSRHRLKVIEEADTFLVTLTLLLDTSSSVNKPSYEDQMSAH